ncbi:MAG: ribonuclease Z [Thermodesulfobacteriota bacterium]
MRPAFRPRLINDVFDDPGLFVPFHFERRALLFDLGDLAPLASRELLSVTHAFVSHAHVDHFIGFDALLRLFLGRRRTLHLYGPSGFFERVEGRLAGYTWNLVEDYVNELHIEVTEVRPDTLITRTYSSRKRFQPAGADRDAPFRGLLLEEPRFRVEAAILDHRIPCLAFALTERFHVNIDKAALKGLGLPVGPWIDRFKAALYEGRDRESVFEVTWSEGQGVEGAKRFELGTLAGRIARITPGTRIAYVTDAGAGPENCERIAALASGADHLFIEAAFLSEDKAMATEKHHLTAGQAGALAGRAGARTFSLFHLSPRYRGREVEFREEAAEAFQRARLDNAPISPDMASIMAG